MTDKGRGLTSPLAAPPTLSIATPPTLSPCGRGCPNEVRAGEGCEEVHSRWRAKGLSFPAEPSLKERKGKNMSFPARIALAIRGKGIQIVVDEAALDSLPSASCARLAGNDGGAQQDGVRMAPRRSLLPLVPARPYPATRLTLLLQRMEDLMDEDRFNMAIRKFLKEVGVTSQREIERIVREKKVDGTKLCLKMTLTSDNAPTLRHVIKHTLDLK